MSSSCFLFARVSVLRFATVISVGRGTLSGFGSGMVFGSCKGYLLEEENTLVSASFFGVVVLIRPGLVLIVSISFSSE